MQIAVGDRVKMSPMWKHKIAIGTVIKITKDKYIVVKWDNINGEWHFTKEQSKKLERIKLDERKEE